MYSKHYNAHNRMLLFSFLYMQYSVVHLYSFIWLTKVLDVALLNVFV